MPIYKMVFSTKTVVFDTYLARTGKKSTINTPNNTNIPGLQGALLSCSAKGFISYSYSYSYRRVPSLPG